MLGIMGADPRLTELLAEPFTLYQAGFDASWELDLWGRVRRSVEAADADVGQQAALLDQARLSLASDVARNYFELRTAQRQIRLMREDIAALEERAGLLQARVEGGVLDHTDLQRQRAELAALKAQLPPLLAQEAASANQIALLLGERPVRCKPNWCHAMPAPGLRCPTSPSVCHRKWRCAAPTSAPPKRTCTAPPPTSALPRPICIPASGLVPNSGSSPT